MRAVLILIAFVANWSIRGSSSRRLAWLSRRDFTSDQLELANQIALGERKGGGLVDTAGRLRGPFNAMLHVPALGDALQNLGGRLRFHGSLTDRVREASVILVACQRDCEFERATHVAIGLERGLTRSEIDVLEQLQIPSSFDAVESASATVVLRTLMQQPIPDEEYEELETAIGSEKFVELVILVGYYSCLADLMNVFGIVD